MADRILSKYEEPRLEDGPHWSVEVSRSAGGAPGLFFTIKYESVDGSIPSTDMTVLVEDGNEFLKPVIDWLATGPQAPTTKK